MKNQWKSLLLLVSALCIVLVYALCSKDIQLDLRLKKADIAKAFEPRPADSLSAETGFAASAKAREDSIRAAREHPDTTRQRILFFGDSMLEGLTRRLVDYTEHNGHELHTVVWYSSTSQIWAQTDTLQHFMREVDPTYVIVCLCANELFVKDLDQREQYVKTILKRIGNIPYVWVSPPNWKEDTGINDVIIRNVGRDRYFDSRHLNLDRGKDHAHPTFSAAAVWADTIASWLRSPNTEHPIRMDVPTEKAKNKHITLLMPYNP
ncbi:MAG: SGNH/GDSL hydrolase family protein [Prevotella sp.]|nr:SGNH/GDSL hydrolase family protein [Prevotella sp.]